MELEAESYSGSAVIAVMASKPAARAVNNRHVTPASFRSQVLGLDARSVRTRIALYQLMDEVTADCLDDSRSLPDFDWVVYKGPLGSQQVRAQFGASAHSHLQSNGLVGVARLVFEAKAWTFEPYHDGWMIERGLAGGDRRLLTETYVSVIIRWALSHPALAVLGQPSRLPHLAMDTLRRLAGGRYAEDNHRILHEMGERLIGLLVSPNQDLEVAPMLNRIRVELVSIRYDDALADEAAQFISAIGRFMSLASTTDVRPYAPEVLTVLEHAVKTLRTRATQEQETA